MSGSDLTATTIRYLFASRWARPADSAWSMHVPGAKVDGLETAGNLISIAVWSLREQKLVEVEQLRPVESERLTVMGGRSFARMRPLPGEAIRLGGLEGALLTRARQRPEAGTLGKLDDALGKTLSGDDEWGLRGLVLALDLSQGSPWASVAEYCREEARAAGLIEVKGRLFKKPVVTDPDALRALEPRDAKIVAGRDRFREREPELDGAVISDCIAAVSWAHQSSPA
jgi:hypothetical protein